MSHLTQATTKAETTQHTTIVTAKQPPHNYVYFASQTKHPYVINYDVLGVKHVRDIRVRLAMTNTSSTTPVTPEPLELDVALTKGDFMYYSWVTAFERPILPFFMYTFVLLNLSSLLGVFPAGNVFAFAVLVPMVGYMILVQATASQLWRRFPQLNAPRHYTFKPTLYRIKSPHAAPASEPPANKQSDTKKRKVTINYDQVRQVLSSRRGFYLLRSDGSADIIPKDALREQGIKHEMMETFLSKHVSEPKASFFL